MRIASWNTRGLGNKSRGRMAGKLVNHFHIQFIAIQETMVKLVAQPILNEIWKHYAFDSIQSESSGRSGGLLSMWRLDFFSLIQAWSRKHWIATILRYTPNNQIVLLVNVYAPHNEQKKKFVWSQLSTIANNWPGPLCFLGDFNSVCHPDERLREVIDLNSIASFNAFINQANIVDQVLTDDEFTREGPFGKFSRIDRVFVNYKWAMLWPDAILQSDHRDRSDHKPLIWAKKLAYWGPRPFRFNNSMYGWAAFVINKKLRLLKAYLKLWNSSNQDTDVIKLKSIEAEIKRLKSFYKSRDLSQSEIIELTALKLCKKKASITIESKRSLPSMHAVIDLDWASLGLAQVPLSVCSALEGQFSVDEVCLVIKGFDGNKTPGPDGFTLQFFKKGWHFLEDNVMEMFAQFHDSPSFPKGFNSSFIVLIPKSNSARTINQMRPISLINAPYKILAKTIANRLKLAIPSIISENQNGFVPSRLLTDGVMVVNEIVHLAKSKKIPIILIKIDFSKAYDCVSHEFLFLVLHKMGFGSKFISWIATCILNIQFSILLNGSPSREGVMHRGLRQGDPLSPFLFIIITEILSKLLSRDLANGFLEGCKFGNNLSINHSQFADDTIIFAQPNVRELNRIKFIMGLFFQLSGLQMNVIKTTLYGIHVSKEDMINFSAIFECKVGTFPMVYLGIPIGFNSNRIAMWDPIVNKFKKKLAGWKGRCLSFGGRLVMVNAVLSNLPLHYMSIYKAPVAVIKQLEHLGGLGVTPLRFKNLAMLVKWWAKINFNKPCLWKSIVTSSFGSSFGRDLMHSDSPLFVSQISYIWRDLNRLQHDPSLHPIVGPNVWK
ncbi:uncharacterized protein [Rutidosis leptorrhynchoides]|uniref:uncharacterized protein n=1 Tax=Rutidosis leptorrhynchoides TaxID=125765 RepID=UPI003A9940F0